MRDALVSSGSIRGLSRAFSALLLALVASCAADQVIPITQVMVVVNSDLAPGAQLTQVSVEVQNEAGALTRDQRSFSVAASKTGPGLLVLPFSFSVVEAGENPARRFRLVVTGWGPPGSDGKPARLVRQTAVASFQPGLTVRLAMYLAQVCMQTFCEENPTQTCYPTTSAGTGAGQCGSIVAQDVLAPVKPGDERIGVDWTSVGITPITGNDGGFSAAPGTLGVDMCPGGSCLWDGSVPHEGGTAQDAGSNAVGGGAQDAGSASGVGAQDASRDGGGATQDAGLDGGATQDAGAVGNGNCIEGITAYDRAGPFTFAAKTSGSIKFWVPAVPAGCKVPVVHLSNGTGASCSVYAGILERLASHGFLAACYEATNTGAGTQGLMALEAALQMYPNLADNKLGSIGQNQGGQAAFVVVQLAEEKWGDRMIYAGLSMQPANGFGTQPAGATWQQVYGKIKSPMFVFSSTQDTLVSEAWVQQAFEALPDTSEAYWWSAIGATHTPVPIAPTQQVSIPWFRWKLLGDRAACMAFKRLADGVAWEQKLSQNERACQ